MSIKSMLYRWLNIHDIVIYMNELLSRINLIDIQIRELQNTPQNLPLLNNNFPTIVDIEYYYTNYKFTNVISKTNSKIQIILNTMDELKSDFRFKYQSNHKLYIKVQCDSQPEYTTSWLDACEGILPIGLLNNNGAPCLDIRESSTYTRVCHIHTDTPSDAIVWVRLGIQTTTSAIPSHSVEISVREM
jgi:hypothetical protein